MTRPAGGCTWNDLRLHISQGKATFKGPLSEFEGLNTLNGNDREVPAQPSIADDEAGLSQSDGATFLDQRIENPGSRGNRDEADTFSRPIESGAHESLRVGYAKVSYDEPQSELRIRPRTDGEKQVC